MKKLNLLFQISTLTSILVAGFFTLAVAQNADEQAKDQKLTIDIEVTENGKTRRITKELDAIEGEDIEAILKNLDILDDIDIRATGERIEIKVKKEVAGVDSKRVKVKVFGDEDEIHWNGDATDHQPRPLLGVFIESYNEDGKKGALVNKVVEGSAAETAGLEEGDVIVAIGKTKITTENQLREAILNSKAGEEVNMKYLRNNQESSKKVTLGESETEGFELNSFHFDFDKDGLREQIGKLKELKDIDFHFDMDFEFEEEAAFLGVTPGDNSDDEKGVVLESVVEGSAAEKMGLKAGDKVMKLDGKSVKDFDELADIIGSRKVGDELGVSYIRNGKSEKTKGELGKREKSSCAKIIHFNSKHDTQFWNSENNTVAVKEITVVIELQDATKEDEEMLAQPAAVNFKKELALNRIEFSPNPSNGQFNLAFELPEKKATRVLVLDQMGRKVNEEILGNFSGTYKNQIDISSQPNGVYFLIIAQGEKQFTRKIVKQ